MSLNAAAIAVMVERGLSAADILAVAQALEVKRDPTAAERQARHRERVKAERNTVTRYVTRDSTPASTPAPFFPPDPQTNPTPASTPVHVTGARPKFPAPEGVTDAQWKAFRQQRKKPLNERSHALLCNKLVELAEAGWPPGKMIDLAIERGWETVFEPKDQSGGQQTNRRGGGSMGGPRPDPTLALVRAATAAQRESPGDHWEARVALPAR